MGSWALHAQDHFSNSVYSPKDLRSQFHFIQEELQKLSPKKIQDLFRVIDFKALEDEVFFMDFKNFNLHEHLDDHAYALSTALVNLGHVEGAFLWDSQLTATDKLTILSRVLENYDSYKYLSESATPASFDKNVIENRINSLKKIIDHKETSQSFSHLVLKKMAVVYLQIFEKLLLLENESEFDFSPMGISLRVFDFGCLVLKRYQDLKKIKSIVDQMQLYRSLLDQEHVLYLDSLPKAIEFFIDKVQQDFSILTVDGNLEKLDQVLKAMDIEKIILEHDKLIRRLVDGLDSMAQSSKASLPKLRSYHLYFTFQSIQVLRSDIEKMALNAGSFLVSVDSFEEIHMTLNQMIDDHFYQNISEGTSQRQEFWEYEFPMIVSKVNAQMEFIESELFRYEENKELWQDSSDYQKIHQYEHLSLLREWTALTQDFLEIYKAKLEFLDKECLPVYEYPDFELELTYLKSIITAPWPVYVKKKISTQSIEKLSTFF